MALADGRWNNNLPTNNWLIASGKKDRHEEGESVSLKIETFQVNSVGNWGVGLLTQLKVWSRTVVERSEREAESLPGA